MKVLHRFATMMSRRCLCLLFLLNHFGLIQAEDAAVFAPPQAYPLERYAAGWSKNPFMLKTTTPVLAQDSFARDLAIGAHYGAADNPTVVVVNIKTNERILLRKDKPAPSGMRLNSVQVAISRAECLAEVVLGGETAMLKYDASYLGQLAASEASRAAKPAAAPAGKQIRLPAPAIKLPVSPPVKISQMTPPASLLPSPTVTASTSSLPVRIRNFAPSLPQTPP